MNRIVTHVFGVERMRYHHARLTAWDIHAVPSLALVLRDMDLAQDHIKIDNSLHDER